jgi:hypothetical protein
MLDIEFYNILVENLKHPLAGRFHKRKHLSPAVHFKCASSGVHVDGDDDGLLDGVANLARELVGSAYAFLQGDVFHFGDQELGVVASELEVFHHGSGNFSVVLVLKEASVGRAFARGVLPMAIPVNLEEDGGLVPGHAQKIFLHQSFDGVEADV